MSSGGNSRRSRRSSKPRADGGWALISVLWTVAILAMLAGAVEAMLLSSAALAQRQFERAEAEAALDGAVVRAVLGIGDNRPERRWRVDGKATTIAVNGLPVAVSVQDQFGLVDLNTADGTVIGRVLAGAGAKAEDLGRLIEHVIDWRSMYPARRDDADYREAGLAWRPRHGPFQSVAELQLVLGMTPEIFRRAAPALTVYSGRPSIDPLVAPAQALQGFSLDDPNSDTPGRGVLPAGTVLDGRTFAIAAQLRIGGHTYVRSAVVMLGDGPRPYVVLSWQ
ncbi:MAG: general secretion pathway protein GspK [Alphaproteobacteria bacterium]|nr:general secretion pathway protein GspK [Alphaproteobacteria bacterium]